MSRSLATQVFVECQAPGCASVLQVAVPTTHRQGDGAVLVRCGKCHKLLRVQLPQELLEPLPPMVPDPTAHMNHSPRPHSSSHGQQHALHPPQGQPSSSQRQTGAGAERQHHDSIQPSQPLYQQQASTAAGSYVAARQQQDSRALAGMGSSGQLAPHFQQQRNAGSMVDQVASVQGTGQVVSRRRRAPTAYQEFVSQEMKRLKATHNDMNDQTAFKLAASSWVMSGAKAAADQAPAFGRDKQQQAQHLQPVQPAEHMQLRATLDSPAGGRDADRQEVLLSGFSAGPAPASERQQLAPSAGDTAAGAAVEPFASAKATMPPPPARGGSNGSDAGTSHLSTPTATPTAAAAATPSPNTADAGRGSTPPPAGSVPAGSAGLRPSVSSSSHDQGTPAPLTLQETWDALCMQHGGNATLAMLTSAGQQAAAAAAAVLEAAQSIPAAVTSLTAEQTEPLVRVAADGRTSARQQQQQQQQQLYDVTPAGAHVTADQEHTTPNAAPAGPGDSPGPAGPAAIRTALLSEGSSLASWNSSGGLSGGQVAAAAADPNIASPGSLSGAGGSSLPSIMRHNSAPITTGFPPSRQNKTAGYSITTAGPAKPGRG